MIVILILSLLVIIHELGHFFAARRVGVKVEEFGIGYPPRAFKLFTWKGTIFSFNWLPFGGFVRLAGDDAESFEGKSEHSAPASTLFHHKSQLQRIVVVLAGAAINILFSVIVFSATYTMMGIPTNLPYPLVDEVVAESPAAQIGLQTGDAIIAVDGIEVKSANQLIAEIQSNRGETVPLVVEQNGDRKQVETYIRTVEETPAEQGSLGVRLKDFEFKHYPAWEMPIRGTIRGVEDSWEFAKMIPAALGNIVVDLVTRARISDDVSGPIGIIHIAQQEQIASQGWLMILNFAAVISLNLGIINIMPIPALDGGRAVFILLESFIGKRRRAKIEGYANNIGMVLLLGLIVLISLRDVWKIFAG